MGYNSHTYAWMHDTEKSGVFSQFRDDVSLIPWESPFDSLEYISYFLNQPIMSVQKFSSVW